jgi:hypothetical protein
MKRQLALLLARAHIPLEWILQSEEEGVDPDSEAFAEEFPEDLLECLGNSKLYTHFREFGKELGVLEPKSLEDIYKSHLENTSAPRIDSYPLSHLLIINSFQDLLARQMLTRRGRILQAHSSTHLSMLGSGTTS